MDGGTPSSNAAVTNMNTNIEGKVVVALLTGANRGIGRALTEALLTRGVRKVYATARNPEALRALRDERLVSLRLDVTDADQIRTAGEAASDVELVFNNAGVALAGGIADSAVLDQARREMEVNSGPRRRPRNGRSPQ
jgi:NADP-dependent 3-hydroxy acid dehydrogenase YdfG